MAPEAGFDIIQENPNTLSISFDATDKTHDFDTPIEDLALTWDLGDWSSVSGTWNTPGSAVSTITHNYSDPGVYEVSLTASDPEGNTSVAIDTVRINHLPEPVVNFTPASPVVGDTVYFSATVTDADGDSIARYNWQLGDGTWQNDTLPLLNMKHVYGRPDTFSVKMNVYDGKGWGSGTILVPVLPENQAPTAYFNYNPEAPYAGESVSFDASGSSDPEEGALTYYWTWGDGANDTTTSAIATHTYADGGNYTVQLTVRDPEGLSGGYSTAITVITSSTAPVARITKTGETAVTIGTDPGREINLTGAESWDSDGTIASFAWSSTCSGATSGSDTTYVVQVLESESCAVTLTVTDNESLTDSDTYDIAQLAGPVADFTILDIAHAFTREQICPTTERTSCYIEEDESWKVSVDGRSSYHPNSPTNEIVSWYWKLFGGTRTSATGDSTAFTIGAEGTYTIDLIVTDDEGRTDRYSETFEITNNREPSANFTWECGNYSCDFTDQSSDSDGSISAWSWDFAGEGTSTVQHPSFTFTGDGQKIVTLTVTDNEGATGIKTDTLSVPTTNPPTACYTFTPSQPEPGATVSFNGGCSSDPDNDVLSFSWSFGDGATSTDARPSHVFASAGNYNVTLTVTEASGARDSESKTVPVVTKQKPIAKFTVGSNLETNYKHPFDAGQSYDPDGGSIVEYRWDWGDFSSNETTSSSVRSHAFTSKGTYTVSLTVVDDEGQISDPYTYTVSVKAGIGGISIVLDESSGIYYGGSSGDTIRVTGTLYDTDGNVYTGTRGGSYAQAELVSAHSNTFGIKSYGQISRFVTHFYTSQAMGAQSSDERVYDIIAQICRTNCGYYETVWADTVRVKTYD